MGRNKTYCCWVEWLISGELVGELLDMGMVGVWNGGQMEGLRMV